LKGVKAGGTKVPLCGIEGVKAGGTKVPLCGIEGLKREKVEHRYEN